MPEVDRYKQGTPCWVDLSSTDIEVSKKFYRELFGWELEAMDVGQGLTYYMAKAEGPVRRRNDAAAARCASGHAFLLGELPCRGLGR
ncbi:hypothetical protein AAHB34_18320 [Paenarthrobacter ureafaciens]